MKKLIFILITLSFISCNNHSFEDYLEWCKEGKEYQYVELQVTKECFVFRWKSDTVFNNSNTLIFGSTRHLRGSYPVEIGNIKDMKSYFTDSSYTVERFRILTGKKQNEKPTIEGYYKWKELK